MNAVKALLLLTITITTAFSLSINASESTDTPPINRIITTLQKLFDASSPFGSARLNATTEIRFYPDEKKFMFVKRTQKSNFRTA